MSGSFTPEDMERAHEMRMRRVRRRARPKKFLTFDRVYGYACTAVYGIVSFWGYSHSRWEHERFISDPERVSTDVHATIWLIGVAAAFSFMVTFTGATTTIKLSVKWRCWILWALQLGFGLLLLVTFLAPAPKYLDQSISHVGWLSVLPLLLCLPGLFIPRFLKFD